MKWMIGHNSRTGLYEIHADGCKHAMHPAFANGFCTVEADTAADAAEKFEGSNDGILTKLGPCARRAA